MQEDYQSSQRFRRKLMLSTGCCYHLQGQSCSTMMRWWKIYLLQGRLRRSRTEDGSSLARPRHKRLLRQRIYRCSSRSDRRRRSMRRCTRRRQCLCTSLRNQIHSAIPEAPAPNMRRRAGRTWKPSPEVDFVLDSGPEYRRSSCG